MAIIFAQDTNLKTLAKRRGVKQQLQTLAKVFPQLRVGVGVVNTMVKESALQMLRAGP